MANRFCLEVKAYIKNSSSYIQELKMESCLFFEYSDILLYGELFFSPAAFTHKQNKLCFFRLLKSWEVCYTIMCDSSSVQFTGVI